MSLATADPEGSNSAVEAPARRRHLALFIRSLGGGGGGGAERAIVQLAGGIAARGHRVDLLLARAEGAFLRDVDPAVRVIDLDVRSAWAGWPALLRSPRTLLPLLPAIATRLPWVFGAVPRLVDYLVRERPDALLSALDYSNFAALLAAASTDARNLSTRTVVIEQNTLSARAHGTRHWRWRFLPGLVRHFYPWASAVVGVSHGVSRDLEGVLGMSHGGVHTIFNPIVSQATVAQAKQPLDHSWFREGEPPVVLAVGKLKPQKDFATLLSAFAELRKTRRVRLVVLGEGPERMGLQRKARRLGVADDVAWPGFVDNPFAFMARADAYVLSSAWEGLPSTLVEAMACGCPVVSTDCPSGPREILDHGRFGPLVPVANAARLCEALVRVLDAPVPDEFLRSRAAHFSIERAVDGYLDLLFPCENRAVWSRRLPGADCGTLGELASNIKSE